MGKVDTNKKEKSSALLSTAFRLFTDKGFSKTTISDIAKEAGLAKGTFYLYFKDKYDIRDRLIASKASQLFLDARDALKNRSSMQFEDLIIAVVDYMIDRFKADPALLSFISKNLSWGVFSTVLHNEEDTMGINFPSLFKESFDKSQVKYKDPLIMIYMIIELVNGTCYSSILYNEPLPINELKPYLFDSIRAIMEKQEIRKETV